MRIRREPVAVLELRCLPDVRRERRTVTVLLGEWEDGRQQDEISSSSSAERLCSSSTQSPRIVGAALPLLCLLCEKSIQRKVNPMQTRNPIMRSCVLLFLAVLIAAMALCTGCADAQTQTGTKTITVDIVLADGTTTTHTLTTDAEFLRGALEEKELIAGDESEYGLFVKTVNGVTINEANQEWWCFTKGGETLFTGVDTTPIADGDKFEITLTVGY